jgi:ribosomal protein L11 methyltransferase
VSERLRIRASFETSAPRAGQRDLVIDPGQAFGTGGHESTRLALAWIDALRGELAAAPGCSTSARQRRARARGARARCAARVGCDLDPLAARPRAPTRARTGSATGSPCSRDRSTRSRRARASRASPRTCSAASSIRSSSARCRTSHRGGWLAISGLLESERERLGSAARRAGSRRGRAPRGRRERTAWVELLMRARR